MQGLRPLFLLRSRLAPKQAGYGEETAFVPQDCITARKTMKTGWRGPCPYKPTKPIRLTCPLRVANLPGSGPPMRKPVFMVWGDSLFSWFSFVSAPRFDAGESAIGGVEGGERRASHKPSAPTMAEGLSPWRWHKGVFLVLVLKTKMHWICRVQRYFLVHHIEHPNSLMTCDTYSVLEPTASASFCRLISESLMAEQRGAQKS